MSSQRPTQRHDLIGGLIIVSVLALAAKLIPLAGSAGTPQGLPDIIHLSGVARDIKVDHPDFGVIPDDGAGQYTGAVDPVLGPDGRPVYTGTGYKILSPATDAGGVPIAPNMANWSNGLTDFEIIDGHVIPNDRFNAKIEVLGVDIGSTPITLNTQAGSTLYNPYGIYNNPSVSNINDNENPRYFVFPEEYEAGTHVTVGGFSWSDSSSSASMRLSANSDDNSPQVIVLRDGDPIPDIEPYPGQLPLVDYIADYADAATNTIKIEGHQVIYLFELWTTDMNNIAADFQDMVVLLSLIAPPSAFSEDGSVTSCTPKDDVEAALSNTPSTVGIDSVDSFGQWFKDTLGETLSSRIDIPLHRTQHDTYLFDSATNPKYTKRGGFYPLDNKGFGNDVGAHNQYFTTSFEANFTYDALGSQFIDIATNGDMWVYINDLLVLDLAGIHGVLDQRIDLDRLCLVDGETYKVSVFYAQRNVSESELRFETNLYLKSTGRPMPVSGAFD